MAAIHADQIDLHSKKIFSSKMQQNKENPVKTHPQIAAEENMKTLYHSHALSPNQCTSIVVQGIDAPLPLVWSLLRKFDNPKAYKQFVKSCGLSFGDGGTGSVREVTMVSGLPAKRSVERLDRLDDDLHVMVFSIIGGDHKLVNYQSTTTLHEEAGQKGGGSRLGDGGGRTVVMESYVVDIPVGSSEEDTCLFADTIIGYNLKALAKVTQKMACVEVA